MGRPAYFIGPWDLNRRLPCVPDRPEDGTVVLVESVAKRDALPFHRKKLVLVLSAMHHFAAELRDEGYDVEVVEARNYVQGIAKHVAARGSTEVVAMRPREFGMERAIEGADFGVPLTLHDDGGEQGNFFLSRDGFREWAEGRNVLRMDTFYRWMRKRTGYLVHAGRPCGGKWSFDADNRKPPNGTVPPPLPSYAPDAITRDQMARVAEWDGHWGEVEGFDWPVTRAQALAELDDFLEHRLQHFGDYQDAMVTGQPYLWHSRLSPAMNLGLVQPHEVVERLLAAWREDDVPINNVEGMLRQILGWREFMRGVYWLRMPHMRTANQLGAHRKLPDFYWEPDKTDMTCLRESISAVRDHAYAHHIQRLMVLGNYGLLSGVEPLELSHWFWAGFIDAFEWVELPNVHGMALFADDAFTTKPYAASGAYVNRMSDYCKNCRYDVRKRSGPDACPFNPLFWNFMVEHRERLTKNPRLSALYKGWDKRDADEREAILATARAHLDGLQPAEHGWTFEDDAC